MQALTRAQGVAKKTSRSRRRKESDQDEVLSMTHPYELVEYTSNHQTHRNVRLGILVLEQYLVAIQSSALERCTARTDECQRTWIDGQLTMNLKRWLRLSPHTFTHCSSQHLPESVTDSNLR